jgi:hypothetical protein
MTAANETGSRRLQNAIILDIIFLHGSSGALTYLSGYKKQIIRLLDADLLMCCNSESQQSWSFFPHHSDARAILCCI